MYIFAYTKMDIFLIVELLLLFQRPSFVSELLFVYISSSMAAFIWIQFISVQLSVDNLTVFMRKYLMYVSVLNNDKTSADSSTMATADFVLTMLTTKTHNIFDFFSGFKWTDSSHPHCSYQLDCSYLSGLINYHHYHFIWAKSWEKKTVEWLASGLFLFVHEMSEMMKTGNVSFFLMGTLRYKETLNFVSQYQQSPGNCENYTFVWFLCLFITVPIRSLCMCGCVCLYVCAWISHLHADKHEYIVCIPWMEKTKKMWENIFFISFKYN